MIRSTSLNDTNMAAKKTAKKVRKPSEREENWAARSRLRRIEFLLWWRGWIRRSDMMRDFGVSVAQTSSDLQRYHAINEGAMTYHLNRKRYEASPRMSCKLYVPRFEDAVEEFFGAGMTAGGIGFTAPAGGDARIDAVATPMRNIDPQIARRVIVALLTKQWLNVKYNSLNSGQTAKRMLAPGALGWDGHRWHLRAWCDERKAWLDFVLGRMSSAEWPDTGLPADLPRDDDWETMETVTLKINPGLDKERREALRMDYGLAKDTLEMRVRKAMKPYLLANLFLDAESGKDLPRHFVMAGGRKR